MQNRSFLIVLAAVAAIAVLFLMSSSNVPNAPFSSANLSLQSTDTSRLESSTLGWSGYVQFFIASGARIDVRGQGYSICDSSGKSEWRFIQSGTYHLTLSKAGCQSLEYDITVPGRGKPICWPGDTACQQSVPEYNQYHFYLALTQAVQPIPPDTTPGTGKTLTVVTDPTYCNVHLFGASEQGTHSTGLYGYTWNALAAGKYTVVITKQGYETQAYSNIEMPGVSSLRFKLPKSTYELTVRTNPCGCDVRLVGGAISQTYNSGTLGATFTDLPQISYTAYVYKEGYKDASFAIAPGTKDTTLTLQKLNTLIINTLPDADVQVTEGTSWLRKTSDYEGRTEFYVSSGKHQVTISKSGYYQTFFQITANDETNQYTLIPDGGGTPTAINVVTNAYNVQIELTGLPSKNTGSSNEAWFTNVASGQYNLRATDSCGHILERTFTFPQEHYIVLAFEPCINQRKYSYRLTVLSDPPSSTAEVLYYGQQDTGMSGTSWYLPNKNTYTVTVSKEGYETSTQEVTINGEDKLLVVTLQQEAPDTPPIVRITGPATAGIRELVTFTVIGDREKLLYNVDFGDGEQQTWDRTYIVSHVYRTIGTYTVRVKAKTDKELVGPEVSTAIQVTQEYKLFTPYIVAGDTYAGKLTDVVVSIPTNLDVDNYYIQVYVRSPKGEHIIPRWTTIDTTFNNGTITGTFSYFSTETGSIRIGAKGIAMDTLNYKDTEEYSIVIKCNEATTAVTGTGETTGGKGLQLPQLLITDYTTSIIVVSALLIFIIVLLVFLIIILPRRKRRHFK